MIFGLNLLSHFLLKHVLRAPACVTADKKKEQRLFIISGIDKSNCYTWTVYFSTVALWERLWFTYTHNHTFIQHLAYTHKHIQKHTNEKGLGDIFTQSAHGGPRSHTDESSFVTLGPRDNGRDAWTVDLFDAHARKRGSDTAARTYITTTAVRQEPPRPSARHVAVTIMYGPTTVVG